MSHIYLTELTHVGVLCTILHTVGAQQIGVPHTVYAFCISHEDTRAEEVTALSGACAQVTRLDPRLSAFSYLSPIPSISMPEPCSTYRRQLRALRGEAGAGLDGKCVLSSMAQRLLI